MDSEQSGRLAHYQAIVQQMEAKWGCTLDQLRLRHMAEGNEDFAADDDYLEWQWYAEAIEAVQAGLDVIAVT